MSASRKPSPPNERLRSDCVPVIKTVEIMPTLEQKFSAQQFQNGYELVNGVAMHAENGSNFQIPPPVIKRKLTEGQFVELRIDSPRFSVHEDDAASCSCPSCNGELTKPIIRHEHPATLAPLPDQNVPSRGWGEDFWVRITDRDGQHFQGTVDNPLIEARLHGLSSNSDIVFHEDHVLAVHGIHRQELVLEMDASELKELAQWLAESREQQ